MTTVIQKLAQSQGRPVFICDFSPPRGADLSAIAQVREAGADFVCVAYSPGKSVRVDSTVMAYLIAQHGQEVIFNLACRDMNRLAVQNHLLGAQALGLENVVVLQGDGLTEKERASFKEVNDYHPSALIQDIARLNHGDDFRGLKLRAPTAFCAGAVMDFGKGVEQEARTAHAKVQAGADFFLAQTFYDVALAKRFHEAYRQQAGQPFPKPIFYGLPVPAKDGLLFGDVPAKVREDMDKGRSGADIAQEQLGEFLAAGLRTIYLVPPILRSGRRDYGAARDVLAAARTQLLR
ncbi:MAG: methylenetetrahydrofolate reductase [Chloroflexi bacterium]|nr:methylenetetrahydrofolate reductase [Chloroflexota bacterium]